LSSDLVTAVAARTPTPRSVPTTSTTATPCSTLQKRRWYRYSSRRASRESMTLWMASRSAPPRPAASRHHHSVSLLNATRDVSQAGRVRCRLCRCGPAAASRLGPGAPGTKRQTNPAGRPPRCSGASLGARRPRCETGGPSMVAGFANPRPSGYELPDRSLTQQKEPAIARISFGCSSSVRLFGDQVRDKDLPVPRKER
jgi:hypothetical protein